MRKFLSIVLSLAALAACQKNEIGSVTNGELATLSVNLATESLFKSTGVTPANEAAVNTYSLLVFNSNGLVETFAQGTGKSIALKVTPGSKNIWVLVNGSKSLNEKFLAVKKKADIATVKAIFTDDVTAANNLPMIGYLMNEKGEETSVSVSGSASVTVYAKRLVSRISIEKIKNDIRPETDAQYAGATFRLKNIFVSNVPGDGGLTGAAPEASRFLNQMGVLGSAPNAMLADMNIDKTLPQGKGTGSEYSVEHSFYTFANPTETDSWSRKAWCARYTRLVVEVGLTKAGSDKEDTYYYPLTMTDRVQANKTYKITSLIIHRHGSDDPETPVASQFDISATIQVVDWTTGGTYSYEI